MSPPITDPRYGSGASKSRSSGSSRRVPSRGQNAASDSKRPWHFGHVFEREVATDDMERRQTGENAETRTVRRRKERKNVVGSSAGRVPWPKRRIPREADAVRSTGRGDRFFLRLLLSVSNPVSFGTKWGHLFDGIVDSVETGRALFLSSNEAHGCVWGRTGFLCFHVVHRGLSATPRSTTLASR